MTHQEKIQRAQVLLTEAREEAEAAGDAWTPGLGAEVGLGALLEVRGGPALRQEEFLETDGPHLFQCACFSWCGNGCSLR